MNAKDSLTFFIWSDTHFGYNPQSENRDHRQNIIQQMSRLSGRPYPPEVGGFVDTPSCIIHCGDFVDSGGDDAVVLADYLQCVKGLDAPSFETLGNHDTAHPNVVDWFVRKHGEKYYSFDRKGIHFICLYQSFDENEKVQALDDEQMSWLASDVFQTDKPIVTFAHDRLDNLPNAEELDSVFAPINVIFMFSGHSHLQVNKSTSYYKWKGRTGVIAGHCRNHHNQRVDPPSGRIIMVTRIIDKEAVCFPWHWDSEEWSQHVEN